VATFDGATKKKKTKMDYQNKLVLAPMVRVVSRNRETSS
jgi:hypothetical protein